MPEERPRDSWCFACGPDNPFGLHIDFKIKKGNIYAEFIPQKPHQGYDGVVHGGILATLLDEAMANLLYMQGIDCTTGRIEIRYRQPAHVGTKIRILGEILEKRLKFAKAKAILLKPTDSNQNLEDLEERQDLSAIDLSEQSDLIIAEATAIFMLGSRPS